MRLARLRIARSVVDVREVRPDDAPRLIAYVSALSADDRATRFGRDPEDGVLRALALEGPHQLWAIAVNGGGRIVGDVLCRRALDRGAPLVADVASSVLARADDRRLARELLLTVAQWAVGSGLPTLRVPTEVRADRLIRERLAAVRSTIDIHGGEIWGERFAKLHDRIGVEPVLEPTGELSVRLRLDELHLRPAEGQRIAQALQDWLAAEHARGCLQVVLEAATPQRSYPAFVSGDEFVHLQCDDHGDVAQVRARRGAETVGTAEAKIRPGRIALVTSWLSPEGPLGLAFALYTGLAEWAQHRGIVALASDVRLEDPAGADVRERWGKAGREPLETVSIADRFAESVAEIGLGPDLGASVALGDVRIDQATLVVDVVGFDTLDVLAGYVADRLVRHFDPVRVRTFDADSGRRDDAIRTQRWSDK